MTIYINHKGYHHYRREDYEKSLPPPSFGSSTLGGLYGPVSRVVTHDMAERLDGWLRKIDEKAEALQEPSANSHKTTPLGVFVTGIARGLRHSMRGGAAGKLLSVAAGSALVIGAASLLGGGWIIGGGAALVALPVSSGLGAVCLFAARILPRVAAESLRAVCNIHVGYSRRSDFLELQKYDEERALAAEKKALGPLCQAVFDDEKLAEKSTPAERANWICGLAKHFPEEFLEAAKKTDKREAAAAAPQISPKVLEKNYN